MLPSGTTTRRRPHVPMQILPMALATKGTRHGNKSHYEKREYRGYPRVPETRIPRTPSRAAGRTSNSSISGTSRQSESMQEYMTSDSESISSINFTGLDKLIGISDGANASRPRFKNQERRAMMQRKASENVNTARQRRVGTNRREDNPDTSENQA
jgi:hypothetical protein